MKCTAQSCGQRAPQTVCKHGLARQCHAGLGTYLQKLAQYLSRYLASAEGLQMNATGADDSPAGSCTLIGSVPVARSDALLSPRAISGPLKNAPKCLSTGQTVATKRRTQTTPIHSSIWTASLNENTEIQWRWKRRWGSLKKKKDTRFTRSVETNALNPFPSWKCAPCAQTAVGKVASALSARASSNNF